MCSADGGVDGRVQLEKAERGRITGGEELRCDRIGESAGERAAR